MLDENANDDKRSSSADAPKVPSLPLEELNGNVDEKPSATPQHEEQRRRPQSARVIRSTTAHSGPIPKIITPAEACRLRRPMSAKTIRPRHPYNRPWNSGTGHETTPRSLSTTPTPRPPSRGGTRGGWDSSKGPIHHPLPVGMPHVAEEDLKMTEVPMKEKIIHQNVRYPQGAPGSQICRTYCIDSFDRPSSPRQPNAAGRPPSAASHTPRPPSSASASSEGQRLNTWQYRIALEMKEKRDAARRLSTRPESALRRGRAAPSSPREQRLDEGIDAEEFAVRGSSCIAMLAKEEERRKHGAATSKSRLRAVPLVHTDESVTQSRVHPNLSTLVGRNGIVHRHRMKCVHIVSPASPKKEAASSSTTPRVLTPSQLDATVERLTKQYRPTSAGTNRTTSPGRTPSPQNTPRQQDRSSPSPQPSVGKQLQSTMAKRFSIENWKFLNELLGQTPEPSNSRAAKSIPMAKVESTAVTGANVCPDGGRRKHKAVVPSFNIFHYDRSTPHYRTMSGGDSSRKQTVIKTAPPLG